MDATNLLDCGNLGALVTPCPKARGAERVRRDHVNLVAVGGKLLGEVPDQNRGAVDRREVRLRDEDEPPVNQVARHAVCSSRA